MLVSRLPSPRPHVLAVGTANPGTHYAQDQIAELLEIPEGIGRRFFRTSGIDGRSLYTGHAATATCVLPAEEQASLLERHREGSRELGREATIRCLSPVGLVPADVDFLCCVSSTGFMMPGLSAMFIRHLEFRGDCQRVDVVGMGCNAALNGLNTTASWALANPGRNALLVCCEINSAIHVRDGRVVTALVNSLFGDGCAAVLINTDATAAPGPEILGFSSLVVPDAWRAISYHWSPTHNKFELYLDRDIPMLLGLHSPTPITTLLEGFGLDRADIKHWLLHAGGKKVIQAVEDANGLTHHDVRHATNILKQAGNLGSATVLFSYEALLREHVVEPGDYGLMVTMGPGATIETALLQW
jgi:alkylresorcinol/alkylpyrone synthase/polyketide synthase Type III